MPPDTHRLLVSSFPTPEIEVETANILGHQRTASIPSAGCPASGLSMASSPRLTASDWLAVQACPADTALATSYACWWADNMAWCHIGPVSFWWHWPPLGHIVVWPVIGSFQILCCLYKEGGLLDFSVIWKLSWMVTIDSGSPWSLCSLVCTFFAILQHFYKFIPSVQFC